MAEIETYLGRLKVSGLREDSLGYHIYTGSERNGDARSWLVPKKEFDGIKTQIIEDQGGIEQNWSPIIPNCSHCWYCGNPVKNPQLFVEEGMYSYGKYIGFKMTGVIHKTCAEKGKKEYAAYKWRIVEADQ